MTVVYRETNHRFFLYFKSSHYTIAIITLYKCKRRTI